MAMAKKDRILKHIKASIPKIPFENKIDSSPRE